MEDTKKELENIKKGKDQDQQDQKNQVTHLKDLDSSPNKKIFHPLSLSERDRLGSILESLLFATDRPQSLKTLHEIFEDEEVPIFHVKEALQALRHYYESENRGIILEEVAGGYQLRTKALHSHYVKRLIKKKSFRFSPSAMEVLSIIAYRQPCIKSDVDQLRGVESGYLVRNLMDKGLVKFFKKSDLPGRPMLYATTQKFLEVFHLKSLKDLPSLKEIEDLPPEKSQALSEEGQTKKEKGVLKSLSHMFSIEKKEQAEKREKEDEEILKKISERISSVSIKADFLKDEGNAKPSRPSVGQTVGQKNSKAP